MLIRLLGKKKNYDREDVVVERAFMIQYISVSRYDW